MWAIEKTNKPLLFSAVASWTSIFWLMIHKVFVALQSPMTSWDCPFVVKVVGTADWCWWSTPDVSWVRPLFSIYSIKFKCLAVSRGCCYSFSTSRRCQALELSMLLGYEVVQGWPGGKSCAAWPMMRCWDRWCVLWFLWALTKPTKVVWPNWHQVLITMQHQPAVPSAGFLKAGLCSSKPPKKGS